MKRRATSLTLAATLLTLLPLAAHAQPQAVAREPYGIGLEGFPYPYPVNLLPLVNEGEQVRMAYMDVAPATPNGRTVLLLHGRNFPSSYWAPVIKTLTDAGYRVVVPDQVGFGKSSKPSFELHFDTLARNTVALLDHLQLQQVDVVAHSLGGMLGVRIARAYPERVSRLLLAAPIGLEDYRLYVPPTPTEKIIENEDKLTADGYRKQLVTNYALKLTAGTNHAVHRCALQYQGVAGLPALAARLCQFGADDLPRAGGARDSADRPAHPVHHGSGRSQRAGQAQRAGSVVAQDGTKRRSRQSARREDVKCEGRSDSECRSPRVS